MRNSPGQRIRCMSFPQNVKTDKVRIWVGGWGGKKEVLPRPSDLRVVLVKLLEILQRVVHLPVLEAVLGRGGPGLGHDGEEGEDDGREGQEDDLGGADLHLLDPGCLFLCCLLAC